MRVRLQTMKELRLLGLSNYEGALVAKYGLLEQTSTISVTSRV